jgi:hypothetical protein
LFGKDDRSLELERKGEAQGKSLLPEFGFGANELVLGLVVLCEKEIFCVTVENELRILAPCFPEIGSDR